MDNTEVKHNKSLLRKHYKDVRHQLSGFQIALNVSIITQKFLDFLNSIPNKKLSISGYYPIKDEFNTLPLLHQLNQIGYSCSLPKTATNTKILKFKQWQNGDQLEIRNNIHEPLDSAKTIEPDIIITPLLASDKSKNRLGYGAGYYDETINQLRQQKSGLLVIGLCFHQQISTQLLPNETHDQKLDLIITEETIF